MNFTTRGSQGGVISRKVERSTLYREGRRKVYRGPVWTSVNDIGEESGGTNWGNGRWRMGKSGGVKHKKKKQKFGKAQTCIDLVSEVNILQYSLDTGGVSKTWVRDKRNRWGDAVSRKGAPLMPCKTSRVWPPTTEHWKSSISRLHSVFVIHYRAWLRRVMTNKPDLSQTLSVDTSAEPTSLMVIK